MAAGTVGPSTLELLGQAGPVTLGYAEDGGFVYLIARDRRASWPIGALREGRAKLRIAGRIREGAVQLVPRGEDWDRVLGLFRGKYGADAFRRWYVDPARVLRVAFLQEDEEPSRTYGRWLESEFDNVAETYDDHILGNRMNRLLRDRSLARLRPLFQGSRALLEIGCGSGMETIPMLRAGHEMLCVDISGRMLEVVRSKAVKEGLAERLRTVKLRARELSSLAEDVGCGAFDGGFSTYGALNCESDLRPVAEALWGLLRPGSAFLAGVYNRWCAFELFGYLLSLQPGRAFARRDRPIRVGASRFCVDVYAYTPSDLVRSFSPGFHLESLEGVPVILPPSDLASYAEKFSGRFRTLEHTDAALGARWPWTHLGDHFLATFRTDDEAKVIQPPSQTG
jgi:SAM-dependent methyltransferase